MITLGLLDDWRPQGGYHTQWSLTKHALRAARRTAPHTVPPSHQQEAYLRLAWAAQQGGECMSRLCVATFDIPGPVNQRAMTVAINHFIGQHDTFRSFFTYNDAADSIDRHVVDPGVLQMTASASQRFVDGDDVAAFILQSVPGPLQWGCFRVGVISRKNTSTVYIAVDHLHTDGISQALSCVELLTLYTAATQGRQLQQTPGGSYLDYCRRERCLTSKLRPWSPPIQQWRAILDRVDNHLPTFPLPVASTTTHTPPGRTEHRDLLDEHQARALDLLCESTGVKFVSIILAAAAVVAFENTRQRTFLGFTPKSTRTTYAELTTVGWFANLIPYLADIESGQKFTDLVLHVDTSFRDNRGLSACPMQRAAEILGDELGLPSHWVVPMISFIDVRRLPGASTFDAINFSVYGNRSNSGEVFAWVNRFHHHTSMTMLFPDTSRAINSIGRYLDQFARVLHTVSADGDYLVR